VSWYQKGKTNQDFAEARDSEWQWHQLAHMQDCTSLHTDNHASTHHSVFYSLMPFLPPNQQRQSTAGTCRLDTHLEIRLNVSQPLDTEITCSFYHAMLCIHGTSHGPVSVSVCHKPVFD